MTQAKPLPIQEAFTYYERLGRVRDYALAHLGEAISVKAAARVACLSPSYFSAHFREKVGIPFSSWLRYLRVERAAQLLREHDHPIGRLAEHVGFSSIRTLERSFKEFLSSTPRTYRLQFRPEASLQPPNLVSKTADFVSPTPHDRA